jgi:predicted DsbA family dithiol-disulfide isomerase
VALRAAATIGADAFDRYRRALLHAYFAEHRTVSERAVLVAVAGESGLDADAFDALLTARGNELAGDVFREHADALERGIFAVPTVAVDRGGFLRGAVDLDAYRHAIALARAV